MSSHQDNSNEQGQEVAAPELTMLQSITKGVVGLGLFAIITAGLIALTQINTADRIVEQEKLARSKALFEIVPIEAHDNDMLADAFWLQAEALGLKGPLEAFIAKSEGRAHALILPVVAADGYTGPIQMIVGIDVNGEIKGVRVIAHKETPGLGDKIDIKKSDWITAFDGRSLDNTPAEAWRVKKDGGDFDQLTGATITPRAIVKALYKALVFYKENQVALTQQAPGKQFNVMGDGARN